jgi:small-conductance mechanosensitive channel
MQNKYPQKPGIDFILKQAFFYWNKTLIFQLLFSIIYFAVFFTSIFFFASKYGIWEQNQALMEAFQESTQAYLQKAAELGATENSRYFSYAFLGTIVFLYPLNLGFFKIFRKVDLNEKIELGDLFAGYSGINFFKYIGYFLFWVLIYLMIAQTIILPFLWVMVTIFVAPLMFFTDKRIFEAMSLNFKALRMFFLEIFVCVIVALLFKYLGFALFLVGGLFTFPFWNAMIYSLYKTIFAEKS